MMQEEKSYPEARQMTHVEQLRSLSERRLKLMHFDILQEAHRLGLRDHDLLIHASGPGPGGQQIKRILRARRAHSYLLVFAVSRRSHDNAG